MVMTILKIPIIHCRFNISDYSDYSLVGTTYILYIIYIYTCQQYYPFKSCMGIEKKKKYNTNSSMGSLTDCESIFQYNKKVVFMPPQETSDHHLSISEPTS